MDKTTRLPRSPELMSRRDTALLVVDAQGKLLDLMSRRETIVWNLTRLMDGARVLGIPVAATEQYPQGLGPSIPEVTSRVSSIPAKLTFSCGGCPEIFQEFSECGAAKVLVAGIEAHVCVQQTVIDLLGDGFRVYLAIDAIGSRYDIDYQTALRRMDSAGATLTTTEAALFEWCDVAGTPEFKQISALVKQPTPANS